MKRIPLLSVFVFALLFVATGCGASLSQPFSTLKEQPITIYRLQNYEPPPQQQAAAAPAIPPQIQQWLNAGAQLLPPGLVPPGLLPGTAPAPVAQNVPRFHNFRILGTMAVTDSKMRKDVLKLFGTESNFQAPRQSCMFAEFGFQIGQPAPPGATQPADILVSLSCEQVQMFNYGWPYGTKTGIDADTSKKIVALVQKAFGG